MDACAELACYSPSEIFGDLHASGELSPSEWTSLLTEIMFGDSILPPPPMEEATTCQPRLSESIDESIDMQDDSRSSGSSPMLSSSSPCSSTSLRKANKLTKTKQAAARVLPDLDHIPPVRSNNKRALDLCWSEQQLTMSKLELDEYLKSHPMSTRELNLLRKARRRYRCRGYSAKHRIKSLGLAEFDASDDSARRSTSISPRSPHLMIDEV